MLSQYLDDGWQWICPRHCDLHLLCRTALFVFLAKPVSSSICCTKSWSIFIRNARLGKIARIRIFTRVKHPIPMGLLWFDCGKNSAIEDNNISFIPRPSNMQEVSLICQKHSAYSNSQGIEALKIYPLILYDMLSTTQELHREKCSRRFSVFFDMFYFCARQAQYMHIEATITPRWSQCGSGNQQWRCLYPLTLFLL